METRVLSIYHRTDIIEHVEGGRSTVLLIFLVLNKTYTDHVINQEDQS